MQYMKVLRAGISSSCAAHQQAMTQQQRLIQLQSPGDEGNGVLPVGHVRNERLVVPL